MWLMKQDRNSPLHEAAFRGDAEIIQLLLNKIQLNNNQSVSALVDLQNQVPAALAHLHL